MRRRIPYRIGTAFLFLCSPCLAAADLKCEDLPTDGSPVSYRFWNDVPRCEGIYVQNVSGSEGMSLVSFTVGQILYDITKDTILNIALVSNVNQDTMVRGMGIPVGLYYRLDVKLPARVDKFQLPLADVVAAKPRPIEPAELGLFAIREEADGELAFAPVSARSATASGTSDLIVSLRPGSDVQSIAWRFQLPNHVSTNWVDLPDGGSALQGNRIDVDLGASLPASRVLFEVSYYRGGTPGSDRFILLSP